MWRITKRNGESTWFIALIKKGNFRFAKHVFKLVVNLQPGEVITIEKEQR